MKSRNIENTVLFSYYQDASRFQVSWHVVFKLSVMQLQCINTMHQLNSFVCYCLCDATWDQDKFNCVNEPSQLRAADFWHFDIFMKKENFGSGNSEQFLLKNCHFFAINLFCELEVHAKFHDLCLFNGWTIHCVVQVGLGKRKLLNTHINKKTPFLF